MSLERRSIERQRAIADPGECINDLRQRDGLAIEPDARALCARVHSDLNDARQQPECSLDQPAASGAANAVDEHNSFTIAILAAYALRSAKAPDAAMQPRFALRLEGRARVRLARSATGSSRQVQARRSIRPRRGNRCSMRDAQRAGYVRLRERPSAMVRRNANSPLVAAHRGSGH